MTSLAPHSPHRRALRFGILALGVAGLLGGCSQPGDAPVGAAAPVARYAAVARGRIDIEGGLLELSMPREGVLATVAAHEGDRVKRGQLLAALDTHPAQLAVDAAQAQLEQAQAALRSGRLGRLEHLLRRLGKQPLGDLLQRIQQPHLLDGDHGLGGQRLQQPAVLLAERADGRALQVEHPLQPAAGADQRHRQLRAHGRLVVQRIVNARPRLRAQIGDQIQVVGTGFEPGSWVSVQVCGVADPETGIPTCR